MKKDSGIRAWKPASPEAMPMKQFGPASPAKRASGHYEKKPPPSPLSSVMPKMSPWE